MLHIVNGIWDGLVYIFFTFFTASILGGATT